MLLKPFQREDLARAAPFYAQLPLRRLWIEGVEYRHIPGFSGLLVSALGYVVTTRKWKAGIYGWPRFKSLFPDSDGYLRFPAKGIGKNGRYGLVHVAVLEAWVGPRPPGCEVRHLDGNRQNNCLANLCWGTHTENQNDRRRHLTSAGEKNHRHKMTTELVLRLRAEYLHKSLSVIEHEHPEFSRFAIWAALSGYTWRHLPGAIPKGRRCSKDTWRAGARLWVPV